MPKRKYRKSAAAMMMVAGGLVAAVATPIDSTLAQEADTQQDTTALQCNGFLPADFSVVGNKLYLIDKDGKQTEVADGRWKTPDGKVIIVQNGVIVSESGQTAVQCNGFLPADFSVVGNKLYLIDKDGKQTEVADGRWKTSDGKVIIVQNGVIVSE